MRYTASLACILAAAVLTGCGPKVLKITSDTYIWGDEGITIHLPPGEWQAERMSGMRMVVFRNDRSPGRIAVQVSPMRTVGQPLQTALERQLLLEFQHRQVLGSTPLKVGTPQDKETQMTGGCMLVKAFVDDKPVMIRACVLPLERKVYDLVCWAPPESFPAVEKEYEQFVKGMSFGESTPPESGP